MEREENHAVKSFTTFALYQSGEKSPKTKQQNYFDEKFKMPTAFPLC